MQFRSTRASLSGVASSCSASEAITRGLAADGGLYVPAKMPALTWPEGPVPPLADVATQFLTPFFEGDPLQDQLHAICHEAFNFPIDLVPLEGEAVSLLELFHGPTAAFKDFGARFLAACFARLEASADDPLTILVATSGDTGGAVAAAFHGRQGVAVDVLFPRGQVSPRQEHQLTCWGDNVRAFRVDGPFDACQKLVKDAFVHPGLNARRRLSSANSINLGRLLPQASYYVWASLAQRQATGAAPSFVIPTGNLGNGLACVWAQQCGAPINHIHFATNDNRTVPRFFAGDPWTPKDSIATLANAMDVGNPSNMERLRDLFDDDQLRQRFSASFVNDDAIRQQIVHDERERGQTLCPHTATAMHAYDHHIARSVRDGQHYVVVATAHPAKFESVVEPLIGREVEVPANLRSLLELPSHAVDLPAQLDALLAYYP